MLGDYLLIFGFSLSLIFVIILAIWISKITKNQRKYIKENPPKEINLDDPPTTPISKKVIVINQFCDTRVVGTKHPRATEGFFITFKEPDGHTFNLSVPKECYDGFAIGQEGILSLVDGRLYGFELIE